MGGKGDNECECLVKGDVLWVNERGCVSRRVVMC